MRFHVDSTVNPPVTTYDVVDNVNNLLLGAAGRQGPYLRTYTEQHHRPAQAIAARPNPAAFDPAPRSRSRARRRPVTPSPRASVNEDVFTTLHDLIDALENAQTGAAGNARLANGINTAVNFDRGIDNLLRVWPVGARLRETDAAYSSQDDLIAQYEQTLSDLRDLDYAKAISDLARQQLTYEAAQKTFAQVQN